MRLRNYKARMGPFDFIACTGPETDKAGFSLPCVSTVVGQILERGTGLSTVRRELRVTSLAVLEGRSAD